MTMCRQPSKQSVQAALSGIVPSHVTVHSLRTIASLRPQRIFEVNLSDGKTLLLSLAPQVLFRLLRHEQSILASEAATVRWLRDAIARNHSTRLTYPTLQRFLPTLLHTSSHGPVELGSAYNVFEHQHGIPIALLPSPPTPSERQRLDKQLGQLYRSLSSITSPSGRFGPVAAVVPKMPGIELTDKNAGFGEGGLMAADGAKNWSTAFQSLLEGILRDGEDMAVTMAYSPIRRHFRRFAHLLNEVKVPRLVVVDLADDTNTLVAVERAPRTTSTNGYTNYMTAPQPTTSSEDVSGERQLTLTGLQDWSSCVFGDPLLATVFSDGVSESFMEGFETVPTNDLGGSSSRNKSVSTHHSTNTGVMSITAITEQTTPPPMSSPPPPPPSQPAATSDDISLIEDLPNAGIRLLLYQVYHAVLCIVKEFYRPRSSQPPSTCSFPSASGTGTGASSSTPSSLSTNRELQARKKLTEALNRLETAMPVSALTLSLPNLPSSYYGHSPSSSSCSSSAGAGSNKKQNHLLGSNSNKSSPVVSARSLLLGGNRSSDNVLAKKKLHHRPSGDMSPAKRAKSASSDEARE